MNPLPIIKKHIKAIESVYAEIKNTETKEKAQNDLISAWGRMAIPMETIRIPAVPFSMPCSVTLSGVATMPTDVGESGSGAVSVAREVVLEPVSDHGVEMGETGPGIGWEGVRVDGDTGKTTFYPLDPVEPTCSITGGEKPVAMIGGWPGEAEVEIVGLSGNRRYIRGTVEGKGVCVERTLGMGWKAGSKAKCRLIRAGGSPLYRMLPK